MSSISNVIFVGVVFSLASLVAEEWGIERMEAELYRMQMKLEHGQYSEAEERRMAEKFRLIMTTLSGAEFEETYFRAGLLKQQLHLNLWLKEGFKEEDYGWDKTVAHEMMSRGEPMEDVVRMLLREAEMVRASAMIFMHLVYYYSFKGYPPHDVRIRNLYRKMAEEGQPRAAFEYGTLYFFGVGVEPDLEKSMRWLDKSGWSKERIYEKWKSYSLIDEDEE